MLLRAPTRSHPTSSDGFTLVEVCWTMAIFGVLAGVAVTSLHGWTAAERQRATAAAIEAALRETQQRSVTESRTLCVDFDLSAESFSVLRGACASAGQVRIEGPVRPEKGVDLLSASFTSGGGGTTTGVTFYPRGTASQGTVSLTRANSDHVDHLAVDGLTGRVSRG